MSLLDIQGSTYARSIQNLTFGFDPPSDPSVRVHSKELTCEKHLRASHLVVCANHAWHKIFLIVKKLLGLHYSHSLLHDKAVPSRQNRVRVNLVSILAPA